MGLIVLILFVITIIVIITRFASYFVYGSLIKDKDWIDVLENQIQNGSELNMFDSSIIKIGELPFISNVPFDILGKYYINTKGIVPRWSKCHKLIKAEFKKLKKETNNLS